MTAPTLPTSTLVRPFKEAPASRAARAIIPQPASPGRPSTTTGPRPRPATAPHPGFPRGCDHPPRGDQANEKHPIHGISCMR